jgi:hypothetical protein
MIFPPTVTSITGLLTDGSRFIVNPQHIVAMYERAGEPGYRMILPSGADLVVAGHLDEMLAFIEAQQTAWEALSPTSTDFVTGATFVEADMKEL